MFLSPAETGGFDEIGDNFDIAFYPPKTRAFAPQTPEIDENEENHPGKMTVCQKHHSNNPDISINSVGESD